MISSSTQTPQSQQSTTSTTKVTSTSTSVNAPSSLISPTPPSTITLRTSNTSKSSTISTTTNTTTNTTTTKLGGSFPSAPSSPPSNTDDPYFIDFTRWLGLIKAPTLNVAIPCPLFEGIFNTQKPSFLQEYKARLCTRPSSTTSSSSSLTLSMDDMLVEARLYLELVLLNQSIRVSRYIGTGKKTQINFTPLNDLSQYLGCGWEGNYSDNFLFTFDVVVSLLQYKTVLEKYIKNSVEKDSQNEINSWVFCWAPLLVGIYGELFLVTLSLGQALLKLTSLFLLEDFSFLKGTSKVENVHQAIDDPLSLSQLEVLLKEFMAKSSSSLVGDKPTPEGGDGFWYNLSSRLGSHSGQTKFRQQSVILKNLLSGAAAEFRSCISYLNGGSNISKISVESHRIKSSSTSVLLSSLGLDPSLQDNGELFILNHLDTSPSLSSSPPKTQQKGEDNDVDNQQLQQFGLFCIVSISEKLSKALQSRMTLEGINPVNTLVDPSLINNLQINQILVNISCLKIWYNEALLQAHSITYLYYQLFYLFIKPQTSASVRHKSFYQILTPMITFAGALVGESEYQMSFVKDHNLQKSFYGNYVRYQNVLASHTKSVLEALTYSHILLFAWSKKEYGVVVAISTPLKNSLDTIIKLAKKRGISTMGTSSSVNVSNNDDDDSSILNELTKPFVNWFSEPKSEDDDYEQKDLLSQRSTVTTQKKNIQAEKDDIVISGLKTLLLTPTVSSDSNNSSNVLIKENEKEKDAMLKIHQTHRGLRMETLMEWFSQKRINDNIKIILKVLLNYVIHENQYIWKEKEQTSFLSSPIISDIQKPLPFPSALNIQPKPFVFDEEFLCLFHQPSTSQVQSTTSINTSSPTLSHPSSSLKSKEKWIEILINPTISGLIKGTLTYDACRKDVLDESQWLEIKLNFTNIVENLKTVIGPNMDEKILNIVSVIEQIDHLYDQMRLFCTKIVR
jgi:hypothetical protein